MLHGVVIVVVGLGLMRKKKRKKEKKEKKLYDFRAINRKNGFFFHVLIYRLLCHCYQNSLQFEVKCKQV